MSDETDFACVPRSGGALWTLRARYLVLLVLDHAAHRLGRPWQLHGGSGLWPCWEFDSVDLERIFHDRRHHDRVMVPSMKRGK